MSTLSNGTVIFVPSYTAILSFEVSMDANPGQGFEIKLFCKTLISIRKVEGISWQNFAISLTNKCLIFIHQHARKALKRIEKAASAEKIDTSTSEEIVSHVRGGLSNQ